MKKKMKMKIFSARWRFYNLDFLDLIRQEVINTESSNLVALLL